ncbi:MAG: hypothetical protein KJO59_00545, partial [Ignavibacteria bacterium]|nr:hypothetical protein [Ignavibacteria bacterium]
MKTLYIISLVLLFSLSGFSQIDTIPTQLYGVTENENYTYISSNTGLYILERDSNNVFGGIHNVQDSLGFLHIHKNYLISGRDHRLKIYDIIQPNDPLLSLDTLLSYEISEFEDFNSYFVIRLDLGNYVDKFYLANIVNDDLQIIFDSDSTNPPLSGFQRNSEFYYPYAFLCFGSWKDTLRVYRYNYIQNNFWRTLYNFIFQKYLTGAAAYFEILFTSDTYTDIMGDPVYNQKKYEIDTLNNIFNYLDSWDYFGTGA